MFLPILFIIFFYSTDIIFSFVLYWSETWSTLPREKYLPKVFESMLLMRRFWPNKGIVRGWLRLLKKKTSWFKWINQLDATISQVYYLTFIYSSTCFGRPHSHHQELNNCSSSLWFYARSVVIAVLLVVVGPVGPTTTNSTVITTLRR